MRSSWDFSDYTLDMVWANSIQRTLSQALSLPMCQVVEDSQPGEVQDERFVRVFACRLDKRKVAVA